jgi:hypothetical protein
MGKLHSLLPFTIASFAGPLQLGQQPMMGFSDVNQDFPDAVGV